MNIVSSIDHRKRPGILSPSGITLAICVGGFAVYMILASALSFIQHM